MTRICICDDDAVTGALLTLDLRAAGFQTVEAVSSAAEAVALFADSAPALLLLDLNMPDGGGLGLLRWLADEGRLERTRVVMLTGEDDLHYIALAKRLGASGYLVKPVDTAQLAERIGRLLRDGQVKWLDDLTTLTAGPAQAQAQAGGAAPAPQGDRRLQLLSVEDDPCNQELVSLFLTGETYAVDTVQTGPDALAAAAAKRYDLMLLDLRLPGLDGVEVVRRLRAGEPARRRLPILALTADVTPRRLAEVLSAGADAYLAKPFTSAELRAAVATRLGAAATAETLEGLNPVVADLAETYGRETVEGLLRRLLAQLERLDASRADAGELEEAAHAIKGAAASLGFTVVSEACRSLEDACRAGVVEAKPLARATHACLRARSQITRLLTQAA